MTRIRCFQYPKLEEWPSLPITRAKIVSRYAMLIGFVWSCFAECNLSR